MPSMSPKNKIKRQTTTAKAELELEGRTYSRINIPMWMGCAIIVGWLVILMVSLTLFPDSGLGGLFKSFFRIGSIIYGGGQVSDTRDGGLKNLAFTQEGLGGRGGGRFQGACLSGIPCFPAHELTHLLTQCTINSKVLVRFSRFHIFAFYSTREKERKRDHCRTSSPRFMPIAGPSVAITTPLLITMTINVILTFFYNDR